MSERTFKVGAGIAGPDVRAWQESLHAELRRWGIKRPGRLLTIDGEYGAQTRATTSLVLKGLGIPQERMAHGVSPWLRTKVRARRLDRSEGARMLARWPWRVAFVRKQNSAVSSPLAVITTDTWGWHPGVHDGLDLGCPEGEPLRAMVAGKIVRADAGGWWGLGAKPSPGHPISDGDGIVILEVGENVGPFRKGMHVGYGHAESARVKKGDHVEAGEIIARAGWANAPHVHLMVNNGKHRRADGTPLGIGDRDPAPFYRYARRNG